MVTAICILYHESDNGMLTALEIEADSETAIKRFIENHPDLSDLLEKGAIYILTWTDEDITVDVVKAMFKTKNVIRQANIVAILSLEDE